MLAVSELMVVYSVTLENVLSVLSSSSAYWTNKRGPSTNAYTTPYRSRP